MLNLDGLNLDVLGGQIGSRKEVEAFFGGPLPAGVKVTRSDVIEATAGDGADYSPAADEGRRGGSGGGSSTGGLGDGGGGGGQKRVHRSAFPLTGEAPRIEFEVG